MCFGFLSETFRIPIIIHQDINRNGLRSSGKVRSDSHETWTYSTDFWKILRSNSWNTIYCEPNYSMWTEGQTWWSKQSLVTILQTCLKTTDENHLQKVFPKIIVWHCSDNTLECTMSNNAADIKGISDFKYSLTNCIIYITTPPKNQQNPCHGQATLEHFPTQKQVKSVCHFTSYKNTMKAE